VRPDEPPLIETGLCRVADDDSFAGAYEFFRRSLDTAAMRRIGAREIDPALPLAERVRRSVESGRHPAGGCSIGAVVDSSLRVRGVEGLSVVDASVFPMHITSNPNLTVHAVAELGAQMLSAAL
jgi:choline dehydrogenase-like flavoprotein